MVCGSLMGDCNCSLFMKEEQPRWVSYGVVRGGSEEGFMVKEGGKFKEGFLANQCVSRKREIRE